MTMCYSGANICDMAQSLTTRKAWKAAGADAKPSVSSSMALSMPVTQPHHGKYACYAATPWVKVQAVLRTPHWMQQPLPQPLTRCSLRRRGLDDIRVTCAQQEISQHGQPQRNTAQATNICWEAESSPLSPGMPAPYYYRAACM